jgi:hypothetical protein
MIAWIKKPCRGDQDGNVEPGCPGPGMEGRNKASRRSRDLSDAMQKKET